MALTTPQRAAPRFHGRLITTTFVATGLAEAGITGAPPPAFGRALSAWNRHRIADAGRRTGVRALAEVVVLPLARLLGFTVPARADSVERCHLLLQAGSCRLTVLVVPWTLPLDRLCRECVTVAAGDDTAWALACNGRALRVVHAGAPWSREHLEVDLDVLGEDEDTQRFVWGALGADAFARTPPVIARAAALSARQGVAVCHALGGGVLAALAALLDAMSPRRPSGVPPLDAALTVLYRLLFLLFAEARGLVPVWHPIYRDRYMVSSLVSTLLAGGRCRGVWEAVQAISRLVHGGCSAGDLHVTAFNGGLFAARDAAALERVRVGDEVMERVVAALGSASVGGRRLRIAYADLDVEQLGSVYERILDRDAGPAAGRRGGDERRASGTFYTPRALTASLVRSTLAPLVADRTSDEILALRVLDPAMGSGAFLVAACRYLAAAVEEARIHEGVWHPADITAGERAGLRREVALRCLYGVDFNPIAVQVARLSLWLATLAADKPLSFLDHRLLSGNSLVGAAPADLDHVPRRGRGEPPTLPLFDACPLGPALEHAVAERTRCATEADDTAAIVRGKERAMATLRATGTALTRWRNVLDLWCARWFADGRPPARALFDELARHLLGEPASLPARVLAGLLDESSRTAARERFVHWPLAFPEVFADSGGAALANPGFDAVVGNPPWDMVRGDSGEADVRDDRRRAARRLTAFVRESGVYQVVPRAHVNRYQLFVERTLQLTRRGGRLGLVLPSGMLSDAGTAPLRQHLLDRADVDAVVGIDNRRGLFPIHRSLRFVLLTATAGAPTRAMRCRFRVAGIEELESAPPRPVVITRRLLEKLSGGDLAVPQLPDVESLLLVERLASRLPALGSAAGWHVHFGRELNATDDRSSFVPARPGTPHRPVLEGKQIDPFRVHPGRVAWLLPAGSRAAARVRERPRLAYRDVAAATNRLTLIAAIVPARCVTTHTLFCLKEALPLVEQEVLCGLLNSFVANYLVRLTVSTHVTASHLARLPVPRPTPADRWFTPLATSSRTLARGSTPAETAPAYVELQAWAARAYGVTRAELQLVLSTFPLIDAAVRARVLERWNQLEADEVS